MLEENLHTPKEVYVKSRANSSVNAGRNTNKVVLAASV